MTKPYRGLTITDLLAIAAMLMLVAAIGVPTLERARELSKRLTCAVNLKSLGGAAEVYADANRGRWMTPPFKQGAINLNGIYYLCEGSDSTDIACVGYGRSGSSTSDIPNNPGGGSTIMSTTRAYWMLVRSGGVAVDQFVCPSSLQDIPDSTTNVDPYYDFQEFNNISYGFQVPFGPVEVRARQGRDHRMIFAADKGPYYRDGAFPEPQFSGPGGGPLQLGDPPQYWRGFNSPNHGGQWNGDGQNALFADGRVEYHRNPAIGIDHDNIYTLITDEWGILPNNRIFGVPAHDSEYQNPYPGRGAFGVTPNFSTTDSLIYP